MDVNTQSDNRKLAKVFRDMADGDYLAARALYKLELGQQFLWYAEQAVEKYLKAILLFNDRDIQDLKKGHHPQKVLDRIKLIKDIPFNFPEDVEKFIKYLEQQGNNRYGEDYAYTEGFELIMLDKTVWYIRRYCFSMRVQSTSGADGKRLELFDDYVNSVEDFPVDAAYEFEIPGFGYLENILKEKKSERRKILVWKNMFYGAYKKKQIKNFPAYSWSKNPTVE